MVDIAISAPARSIEAHAMSTSRLRITSRIETWWTSTSYIETSSESGSIPWLMVRLPCGSRSTQSTRWSRSTKAAARLRAVVVLATPPFWFVKAMTLAVGSIRSAYSHAPARFLPAYALWGAGIPERVRRPPPLLAPRHPPPRHTLRLRRLLQAGQEAVLVGADQQQAVAASQGNGRAMKQVLGVVPLCGETSRLAQLESALPRRHRGRADAGEHEQALGLRHRVQARVRERRLGGVRRGHHGLGREALGAELAGDQGEHRQRAGVAARVSLGALLLRDLDGLGPADAGGGQRERLRPQVERPRACGASVGRLAGVGDDDHAVPGPQRTALCELHRRREPRVDPRSRHHRRAELGGVETRAGSHQPEPFPGGEPVRVRRQLQPGEPPELVRLGPDGSLELGHRRQASARPQGGSIRLLPQRQLSY